MEKLALISVLTTISLASPVAAEWELSLYIGLQGVQDSTASGTLPDGTPFSSNIGFEGRSFEQPYYYGGRAIWWTDQNIGFGVEGTHTKAIAPDGEAAAIGFDRFELSDGHNIFTANIMKRWPGAFNGGAFTPYIGGGFGIAVPHVDAIVTGSSNRTFGFEATGPALRAIAGIKYDLTDKWGIFGEYQFTYSNNDITIDGDPLVGGQPDGNLDTEILTHAFNVGIGYSF